MINPRLSVWACGCVQSGRTGFGTTQRAASKRTTQPLFGRGALLAVVVWQRLWVFGQRSNGRARTGSRGGRRRPDSYGSATVCIHGETRKSQPLVCLVTQQRRSDESKLCCRSLVHSEPPGTPYSSSRVVPETPGGLWATPAESVCATRSSLGSAPWGPGPKAKWRGLPVCFNFHWKRTSPLCFNEVVIQV